MSETSLRTELALWVAVLAGFSPVIAQFVRFEAWFAPPSTLVAPVLIAICLWRRCAPAEPPRPAGAALIAAGLVLELTGVALRIWSVAWLGFPVAVVGMAVRFGRPSWRIAVLALGLVPIPESIRAGYTPAPESALLSGACAAWRALGVAYSCTGPVARLGDRHLELVPDDAGWTLAPLLAQLGWFFAVNERASAPRALLTALLFAAATVVVTPLAVSLALGLLAVSTARVAHTWLSLGVWLGCAVGIVMVSLREQIATPRRAEDDT